MKEILTPFFASLSLLSFPQASQILASRTPSPPSLSLHIPLSIPKLFACLNFLCVAEASYYRRTHLSSSKSIIPPPESSLYSSYSTLLNDLKQLIPSLDGKSTVSASTSLPLGIRKSSMGLPVKYQPSPPHTNEDDEETIFYETLVQQLILLVQLRMEMMGVYHFFVVISTPPSKISTYDKVGAVLDALSKKYIEKFTHTLLQQIKKNISWEVNALHSLVSAQMSISRMLFKDVVLLLFNASNTLKLWKTNHTPSQILSPSGSQSFSNLSSGSISVWPDNGVYQFLGIFLSALIAKSALYFYYPLKDRNLLSSIASPPTTPNYASHSSLLGISASSDSGSFVVSPHSSTRNLETDYISAIGLFVHKTGASNFSLIFECKGSPFSKFGYSCITSDPPTGIHSYPAIFSFPKEPPILEHWPTLISLVMQNDEELSTQPVSDCVYFYDTKLDTSYFINRTDVDVFMVAIFKEKKKSTDSQIRDFMSSISRALRNVDIFSLLRSKSEK